MVNVKNLFGMAVMASALVACSSNDDVNPNPENPTQKGQAYAAFKINLPTTNGTRADEDPKPGTPEFDGGDASEYAVNNGTVLVFQKGTAKSEGDYTFVTSAPLTDMNPWKGVGTDGVTTEATIVVDLGTGASNTATDYYALVLLNNNVDDETGKIILPTKGDTFKKWSEKADNATEDYASLSNGIVMANAPQYVNSSTEPTTLVNISGIYPSKEQAAAHTATNIYVERGLAKVTVNTDKYADETKIDGGTYNEDNVQILDWGLDVINKKTYPVHVTTGLSTDFSDIWSTERFYDGSNTTFKRVYWAKDPNYSGYDPADVDDNFYVMKPDGTIDSYSINDYTRGGAVGETGGLVDVDKSYYCCENTFDINNMLQNQTTRVVFRAKYSPKDMTDGENDEYGGTFFMLGTRPETWTPTKFLAQIKTYVVEAYNKVNPTNKISVNKVSIDDSNLKAKLESGAEVASEDVFDKYLCNNISVNGSALTDADGILTSVKAKLGKVYTYANGISYYVARIKHFNERTPWAVGEATYDNNNADYLGRYGVVRNNWYNLKVNKISNPGSPTVPTVTNDPDDENKSYISVSINILDWAKRSQNVEL